MRVPLALCSRRQVAHIWRQHHVVNCSTTIMPNLVNNCHLIVNQRTAFSFDQQQLRTFTSSAPTPPKDNVVFSIGRLNHIAIACPDLNKASDFYRDVLGAKVSEAVPLPEHGVYTVFVELNNTKIELLHPLGDNSPIAAFMAKNKDGGMHHVCLEVDDITVAVDTVKSHGVRCLGKEPKIGAHGKPVMFLHPKDCGGVLVEMEQI